MNFRSFVLVLVAFLFGCQATYSSSRSIKSPYGGTTTVEVTKDRYGDYDETVNVEPDAVGLGGLPLTQTLVSQGIVQQPFVNGAYGVGPRMFLVPAGAPATAGERGLEQIRYGGFALMPGSTDTESGSKTTTVLKLQQTAIKDIKSRVEKLEGKK